MNQKSKIEKNFNAASNTYNEVDQVQKKCAIYLTDMLNKYHNHFTPEYILDIGSGTGNMTDQLYKIFSNAKYDLKDISLNMLKHAQNKYYDKKKFSFLHGDIEKTPISNYYDLIVSNLCFQWLFDLNQTFKNIYNKSKIMACSLLLDGTFQEWQNRLISYGIKNIIQEYPDLNSIKIMLGKLNPISLHIENKDFIIDFNSPVDIIKYLKKLGANTTKNIVNFKKLYSMIKNDKSPCVLRYKVVFIIMERKI